MPIKIIWYKFTPLSPHFSVQINYQGRNCLKFPKVQYRYWWEDDEWHCNKQSSSQTCLLLTLTTRDHFSYEFVSFLRTAGLLGIRYKPPIFAKFNFCRDFVLHDCVTSAFAYHYIPLSLKSTRSCYYFSFMSHYCFFTCSLFLYCFMFLFSHRNKKQ